MYLVKKTFIATVVIAITINKWDTWSVILISNNMGAQQLCLPSILTQTLSSLWDWYYPVLYFLYVALPELVHFPYVNLPEGILVFEATNFLNPILFLKRTHFNNVIWSLSSNLISFLKF